MRSIFPNVIVAFLCIASATAQDPQRPETLAASIARISPHVAGPAEHDLLRTQLGRASRDRIAAANRASSVAWREIDSREAWDSFRRDKIAALRRSLGDLPPRPAMPKSLVTGQIAGEGFKIQNLVFESRPGLVVTANLYSPDPPRPQMPGIVLAHAHHNPKEQGELQDMGMTWARAGCYVLVPDMLGHGERRQHPFATAADYAGTFQVGRQDYYFRYDTSLQLYLLGESLMGWFVHDLMTGVDLLLSQPAVDREKIILLGSVAGGGDPAAVTAALDERIAAVVPFNFGGPQPETRYPLPADADAAFNYAGGGSWESTRNLYRSAADGFLPWVIVASVAPRHLIHAHEFAWDQDRDPVWQRYQKIWGFYGAGDKLSFAHGHGTLTGTDPPGSHCNNIGAVHRRQVHAAFSRWFGIDVRPDGEYSSRRKSEELTCLTEQARREFQPKLLHQILATRADEQLAAARDKLQQLEPTARRAAMRESWSRLLGGVEPPRETMVRDGSPPVEQLGGINVRREFLDTEPGITIAMLTLSLAASDKKQLRDRPAILGVATDGIAGALKRRGAEIADGLKGGAVIALVEVRGMGACGPGNDHGQQSALTANAASELMLGQTLLGGQLREDIDPRKLIVLGGSGIAPLPADAAFLYPRRIENRPPEVEPNGAILALLLALFEDDVSAVAGRHGLVSFRSILDSPFVQVPLEGIVPGIFNAGDISDLVATLAPRTVALEAQTDGTGRLASAAAARQVKE
jgi:dienelactone hydrolase